MVLMTITTCIDKAGAVVCCTGSGMYIGLMLKRYVKERHCERESSNARAHGQGEVSTGLRRPIHGADAMWMRHIPSTYGYRRSQNMATMSTAKAGLDPFVGCSGAVCETGIHMAETLWARPFERSLAALQSPQLVSAGTPLWRRCPGGVNDRWRVRVRGRRRAIGTDLSDRDIPASSTLL
jgi:hypothetical protein